MKNDLSHKMTCHIKVLSIMLGKKIHQKIHQIHPFDGFQFYLIDFFRISQNGVSKAYIKMTFHTSEYRLL